MQWEIYLSVATACIECRAKSRAAFRPLFKNVRRTTELKVNIQGPEAHIIACSVVEEPMGNSPRSASIS